MPENTIKPILVACIITSRHEWFASYKNISLELKAISKRESPQFEDEFTLEASVTWKLAIQESSEGVCENARGIETQTTSLVSVQKKFFFFGVNLIRWYSTQATRFQSLMLSFFFSSYTFYMSRIKAGVCMQGWNGDRTQKKLATFHKLWLPSGKCHSIFTHNLQRKLLKTC